MFGLLIFIFILNLIGCIAVATIVDVEVVVVGKVQ